MKQIKYFIPPSPWLTAAGRGDAVVPSGPEYDGVVFWDDFSDYASYGYRSRRWNDYNTTVDLEYVTDAGADAIGFDGSTPASCWCSAIDIEHGEYEDFELLARIRGTCGWVNGIVFRSSANGAGRYRASSYTGGTRALYLYDEDSNILGVTAIGGWVGSTDNWIRIRCVGTSIKMRIWDVGSAEPGTWTIDVTDSLHASGYFGLEASADGAAQVYFVRSFEVEDLTGSDDFTLDLTAEASGSIFNSILSPGDIWVDGSTTPDGNAKRVLTDTELLTTLEAGPATDSLSAPGLGAAFDCEADCHIRTSFTVEDGQYYNVLFRYTDSNNYVAVKVSTDRVLTLEKYVAGAQTVVDTGWTFSDAYSYLLDIVAEGTSVEVYVNGILACSGTISDHATAAQGYTQDDLATNDIELRAYPLTGDGALAIHKGKATPAYGDPSSWWTTTGDGKLTKSAGIGALFQRTIWGTTGSSSAGWDSDLSGAPNNPTHLINSAEDLYIQTAGGAKLVTPGDEGDSFTTMLIDRSGTYGHHHLQHVSGQQWKLLYVDEAARLAATAYLSSVIDNRPIVSEFIALLDLAADGSAAADFAEVTDSETNPANNTTYIVGNNHNVNFTWTSEAGTPKFVQVQARKTDANNYIEVGCDLVAGRLQLKKKVSGSLTLVDQTIGAFSDGVSYEIDLVSYGSSIKVFIDKVLSIDATISDVPDYSGALGGVVYNTLDTNDIVLTTHPYPALGGTAIAATDRVICPQDADTASAEDDNRLIIRNIIISGDTFYFSRVIDADNSTGVKVKSTGQVQIFEEIEAAFSYRASSAIGAATDNDDIELVVDGSSAEVFVNGVSVCGTANLTTVLTGGGFKKSGSNCVEDAVEFWPLTMTLPFTLE